MTSQQLKNTPLPELKRIALEDLKITKDQVREYGHLSYRATWENAIASIRDGIKQLTIFNALDSVNQTLDNPEPENVKKNRITSDSHIAIELGWASPLADPHIAKVDIAEIINPANLIKLSQTNSHFLAWEPWMEIGRRVLLRNGTIHTILFFKKNGDCFTIEDDANNVDCLDCDSLAKNGVPIIKNNLQCNALTHPIKQAQAVRVSKKYEVIQSSPEPDLYTFESSPESPSATAPKLPLEDFFRALFLGLPVLVPNQSA